MKDSAILVVDDSPVVVEAVSEALIKDGFKVFTAADGIEALDAVKRHSVDLILLDIDMPRMNGYQVCKLLKRDPAFKHIPIVMLTAKSAETDRIWGLKAGSDEYLTKPFNYAKVKEVIRRFVK
ncbi:MAG TPA: response regulator [bacterium]|nr:MAG: Alkaline phosphatase synthesis transcriptional regulatory protein PhoP [bacterium ADurb.Bin236]HOC93329.1 response regulator [bacterium]HPI75778.1 response regulator [bacterium]HPN95609.1 response regulator [bacterium]